MIKEFKLTKVSKRQNDIYDTVVFMLKMNKDYESIKSHLYERYQNQPEDIDSLLAYAIFLLLPKENGIAMEKINEIKEALNLFNEIIEIDPHNWLAIYYKVRVYAMFPDFYSYDEEILEDLSHLIEMQEQDEYEPYYLLSYLQCAETYLNAGEKDKAQVYLDKVQAMEKSKVPYLSDLFYRQLLGFITKLEASGENQLAKEVLAIGKVLFPQLL